MRVLLTNDDGFDAPGLKTLFKVFKESRDVSSVTVAAPERQKSCSGLSLTLHKPLRFIQVEPDYYKVNGSPADCVCLAAGLMKKGEIDIVVSGINEGPNLGNDVAYSGTVSAAIQATNMGIKGIAVSLATWRAEEGLLIESAKIALEWAKKFHLKSLPDQTFLNINIPAITPNSSGEYIFKSQQPAKLGKRTYDYSLEQRTDPREKPYYWNCGKPIGHCEQKDTDCSNLDAGVVAVTPIKLDYTNYEALRDLKNWL